MAGKTPNIFEEIRVDDRFQQAYSYCLTSKYGDVKHDGFQPHLTPAEMLEMGVFEGKYINDCRDEFPDYWYKNAKISDHANVELNYFGVKSRQPLEVWRKKGWIIEPDPRGWFQWYCRFFMGRRLPEIDLIQIKRWRSFSRHRGQVVANCHPGDIFCRPRQRQALLQWSYDPMV